MSVFHNLGDALIEIAETEQDINTQVSLINQLVRQAAKTDPNVAQVMGQAAAAAADDTDSICGKMERQRISAVSMDETDSAEEDRLLQSDNEEPINKPKQSDKKKTAVFQVKNSIQCVSLSFCLFPALQPSH